MLPEAKNEDLLYVSSTSDGNVYVFSYRSQRLVGTLTDVNAAGLCSDRAGDVFAPQIDSRTGTVLVFAHGGTAPVRTLENAGSSPNGCSVNPENGDLAVSDFTGPTFLSIYGHGLGSYAGRFPTREFTDEHITYLDFCGYDGHGDLIASGTSGVYYHPRLVEVARGAQHLKPLHLHPGFGPGALQWDGKYLAFGADQAIDGIQRYTIRRHHQGAAAGLTRLQGSFEYNQFWIAPSPDHSGGRTVVIAESTDGNGVQYFSYPAGGAPKATISSVPGSFGVTVSLAK